MGEFNVSRKGINYKVLYDDIDRSLIDKYLWFIDQDGYAVGYRKDLPRKHKIWIKMHRLIMYNELDLFSEIDHANHNIIDNRKQNLRVCTRRQNSVNVIPTGGSKYLGVCIVKRITRKKTGKIYIYYRYCASIRVNGKRKYRGYFKTEVEAAIAYDNAAKIYHGEFANLNFK